MEMRLERHTQQIKESHSPINFSHECQLGVDVHRMYRLYHCDGKFPTGDTTAVSGLIRTLQQGRIPCTAVTELNSGTAATTEL